MRRAKTVAKCKAEMALLKAIDDYLKLDEVGVEDVEDIIKYAKDTYNKREDAHIESLLKTFSMSNLLNSGGTFR